MSNLSISRAGERAERIAADLENAFKERLERDLSNHERAFVRTMVAVRLNLRRRPGRGGAREVRAA